MREMEVVIRKKKESAILFEGGYRQTGVPLQMDFSSAYRLSRIAEIDVLYESVPYDPALWKDSKFINFMADVNITSGFGGVSFNLIKASFPEVQTALAGQLDSVNDQTLFAARNRPLNQAGAGVWHDQPRDDWNYSPFKKNICIVPFETTVIPRSWIPKINSFDALFVPCEQNIEAFKASGVKVPIELIHWGVDPARFYPLTRPESDIFTFGTLGMLTERKGTDILLEAFAEEFPNESDIRLICKTSGMGWPFWDRGKDKRIELQMGPVSHGEMIRNFYQRVDCFVFPTRGEGFGLTPLEAMATGMPAIVTGWSGPMEYMKPEVGWTIDYALAPAQVFTDKVYKEECGNWAEPSKADLRRLMRYAYTHRDEVRAKGAAAAKYVQDEWLWKDKIKMYEAALAKHL